MFNICASYLGRKTPPTVFPDLFALASLVGKVYESLACTWPHSRLVGQVGCGPETGLWDAKGEVLGELSPTRRLSPRLEAPPLNVGGHWLYSRLERSSPRGGR